MLIAKQMKNGYRRFAWHFITNVLIIPILSFLLAFGFIFLIGGALFEPLGFLLSIPISFLLQYLIFIVDFFSQLPFAAVRINNPSLLFLVFLYIPIALFYWKNRRRQGIIHQWQS